MVASREPIEVVVRHAEPSDAAALQDIMSQPRALAGTLHLPFPSVAEWTGQMGELPDGFRLLVACIGDGDGRPIGNLGLVVPSPPRRRHVASLGMTVHDDWAGRGVGTALMEAAMDLCDAWLQVTRVELEVYPDNGPALALYHRFGFELEGTRRASVFRDGVYVDTHLMARLHPRLVAELDPTGG